MSVQSIPLIRSTANTSYSLSRTLISPDVFQPIKSTSIHPLFKTGSNRILDTRSSIISKKCKYFFHASNRIPSFLSAFSSASNEDDTSLMSEYCEGNSLKSFTFMNPETLITDVSRAFVTVALVLLQVITPFPYENFNSANAVLYSPDTKVPRTAEIALRKSVPVINSYMGIIQESLDDIFYFLRIPQRKPYNTMESNVQRAVKVANEQKESIIGSVPDNLKNDGLAIYNNIIQGKDGLEGLLSAIQAQDPDKISIRLATVLDNIARLEILQAPNITYAVPSQYANLPRLTGRAVAEFSLLKYDGSTFNTLEGQSQTGMLEITLDGYSSPLTAGNFANLLLKRAYDGVAIKVAPQAILAEAREQNLGNELPLEIFPSGEFQPIYKTPLVIQDGELPVLPMSVFGSVAMSHSVDSDTSSNPSQFFLYLYDRRNSGLGGLSFEEGQFSVFGYITRGKELLSQLKTGDVIQSARLISGMDRLVIP